MIGNIFSYLVFDMVGDVIARVVLFRQDAKSYKGSSDFDVQMTARQARIKAEAAARHARFLQSQAK